MTSILFLLTVILLNIIIIIIIIIKIKSIKNKGKLGIANLRSSDGFNKFSLSVPKKKYKKSRENIKPHGVGTSYKKGRDVELF